MKKILLILAALTVSAAAFAEKITTLDSLIIKGKATKMEYEVGEAFDPAGLEVWGIYTKIEKHDSTSQITEDITWDIMPEIFEWAYDNESVTIVANYEGLPTADTTITGINVKETKYYAQNNWDGGDWTWKEMTKSDENVYTLDRVVFGGTGVNINTKEEDTDAKWFDLKKMTHVNDTIQAMDTVRFDLTISQEDTVLTATLLGRPAPVARKEFVFVAGAAAEGDPVMFALTWGDDGSDEPVKMTKKEDDIYVADILPTVDSVVLVRCATGATDIIWDGEGMNVWNQTGNYHLSDTMYFGGWVEETNLFILTSEPPKPVEAKYYAQNNWDGEEDDWTWKEMTKSDENVYTLNGVVFGGTGVNINTKEEDADAKWFDLKKMTHVNDTIQAMDTVRFVLTISQEDTVLTAELLGRPAPVARKEFVFVAGAAAEGDPAIFASTWSADGSSETVKMSKKEDGIYVADILTAVDSVVLARCVTGATEIIWEGEGKNVLNQTVNYHLSDTMYFGGWVEETNLFILTTEPPKPAPKVDKTGITINGRKYGFPVRMVADIE